MSEDEEFLAVGLSNNGSEWMNINVIWVEDKDTELDSLSWVSFLTT